MGGVTSDRKVLAALREQVRADLSLGFFPHQRPPSQQFAEHTNRIFAVTIGRADSTRGRLAYESPADEVELLELMETARGLLNGDWSVQRLQHFCYGECCKGQKLEVCVERCVALLAHLVFRRLGAKVPASNRWYTFAPSLCTQSLGLLCHGILRRVIFACAFGGFDAELEAEYAENSAMAWKSYVTRKHRTSADFLADYPENAQVLAIACVVTEPVDKLSARLQHLDHHSCSAQESI